jgi:hypothetical protein
LDKPLQQQVETGNILTIASDVISEIFGKEIALGVKPLFVKNRTLTLSCRNSLLSQEIHLNQAKIVEQINTKMGQKALDRIRYLL